MAGEIGWFPETGSVLASFGFGLPVVNFMRGTTMLAQVRATTLTGTTTLTVPFSTNLTVGAVQAQVYAQTGNATYSLRSAVRRVGKECRSRWSPYHFRTIINDV